MTDTAMQPDRAPGPRDSAEHEAHSHPGVMTYVAVAVVLTVLTALEVAVSVVDIPAIESAVLPILLTLTAGKFVLVVMFYMHLKMDSRLFTWVFVAPLVLAMFMVIGLVILFKVLPLYAT